MKKLPGGCCENKAVALCENALRAGEKLFLAHHSALRVVFAEMPDRHFFFIPALPVFISLLRQAFFIRCYGYKATDEKAPWRVL